MGDAVNHPKHYTAGKVECIDAIESVCAAIHLSTLEAVWAKDRAYIGYLTGTCMKYLFRWPMKGGLEDLKKARFYLDRLISLLES